MNRALLRKELRDLLPWGVLAVAVGVSGLIENLRYQVDMLPLGVTFGLLNDVNALLYWLIAFAIGTGLSTRELEDKTLGFLDGLPVSRTRVFLVKCAVIGALVLIAPVIQLAAIIVMHLLSRGSLDHDLHVLLIGQAFALQALLVINGLMLGAAFGRLRSLTWLAAGIAAAAVVILSDEFPRTALLSPLSLLDWQLSGTRLVVDAEAIRVHVVATGVALLIAWRGFVRADRARTSNVLSRPLVGALVTIATVGIGIGVVLMVSYRTFAPQEPRGPTGAGAPGARSEFEFAVSAPAQTLTRHYRLSYPSDQAQAALALADEADQIFERVHAMLGVPLGDSIDVDASGSSRNTHGTAFFGRLRMTLDSEVRAVLAHETAHVVAQRAAGSVRDWLWREADVLSEGLASWVEAEFRAPSTRAEDRLLVLAALQERRELRIEALANPALLGMTQDENLKYSAGEALIAAIVRVYGEAAIPRLLSAFADPRLPSDLRGMPLWQATFQLAELDLSAVVDEFYREVTAQARTQADRIAALPRPRVRLVRAGNLLGVELLVDSRGAESTAASSFALRSKPSPDSPSSSFRTYDATTERPIWLPPQDIAGSRVCVQAGLRIGGEILFEPLTCLPRGDAVQWRP